MDATSLSRRFVIGAVPAIGAAIVPLTVPLAAPEDNVARLIEVEQRLKTINAAIETQYSLNDRCARVANRESVPCPRFRWKPGDNPARANWRHERAKERFAARRERIKADAGLTASEARLAELRDERDDTVYEASKLKATTIDALKLKARISKDNAGVTWSVIADLLALES